MKYIFFSVFIITLANCKDSGLKEDTPPPLFPQPITVALNTATGYRIHPVTGDSIRPVLNSLGDTVKTGIPIAVTKKLIDPSGLEKPKKITASWTPVGTPETNVHPMPGNLKTVLFDESKFRRFIIGKDTNSFVLKGAKQNLIPTGVPIIASGKTVPCKLPRPAESLPMSVYHSSNYDMRYLDTYHGLKYQNIYCVTEDRKGNLWICSTEGLSRFNGEMFLHFTELEGLMSNRVYYVLEDRKGNIWIDHGKGDITCYDGDKFIQYDFDNIRTRSIVGDNTIFEDGKGNIWFTNAIMGVSRFDGKNFTHYTKKEGLNSTEITCIAEDSRGNLWFGSEESGASCFDGNSFTYFTEENGLNSNSVHSIFEDRNGIIWFGTQGGVTKYDGKSFVTITEKDGLTSNSIGTITQDSSGGIWISTYGKGINKLDEKTITHFTEKEGLISNLIWDMIPGRNGGVWIATTKGIVFFDTKGFVHKNLTAVIPSMISSIGQDGLDTLLLGTSSAGLFKFDGKKVWKLDDKDSASYRFVKKLIKDKNNNLWIATFGNGLLRFDGNHLEYYTEKEGLTSKIITSLMEDSKGNIWIGTAKGITIYDGRDFFHLTGKEGLSDELILSILEDKNRNIWIGSRNGGLTRYDGKNFIHYTEKDGLGANWVNTITQDQGGLLWIGSVNDVTIFTGKEFIIMSKKSGLPERFVTHIYCDNSNKTWILKLSDLLEISSDYSESAGNEKKIQGSRIINHSELKGLGLQFVGSYVDEQGRLWMSENHKASLTMIDLGNHKAKNIPPEINLYNVDINSKSFNYRKLSDQELKNIKFSGVTGHSNTPQNLKVPHYYNQMTFDFYAPGQISERDIQYCHKIEELNNDWSLPASEGKAEYKYLPPGTYTFKARAMNRSQVWGKPFEYRFTIMPPFWQRWWFLLFCAVVLFGIITWVVQKRIARVRKREIEKAESQKKITELENQARQGVLNERLRISSELHDEVGATLSGIAMYSHLTKEQIKTGEKESIEKSLSIMQQSSAQMVDKLNDIVWFINPGQDSLQKLISRLEEYAINMAAIKHIRVKTSVPENIHDIHLPVENRRNIYLFCKEAINNAVKYSNATQLELIVIEKDGKLEFTVSDNGKGFDAVMVRRGNGLENMQKRADEIGAKLILQSGEQTGTLLSLQCNITQ